ncbi:MAG: lipase maturation factor family protein [Halobacteriales archaeon]
MGALIGEPYWLVRFLLHRGLALVYLVAFLVAARQFRPLAGEDGLLPLERYVDRRAFRERPSLFYRLDDDRVVGAAAWIGVALAIVALLGGPAWLARPYAVPASMLLWAVLWLLYLSFVNAGQLFYGYGWESMLLEAGFLAVFLGPSDVAAPAVVVWLFRWVLFRDMFGAGLIKLRGDECWRDLTCLDAHYETQPMPNPLSWFAHHLPDRFHRLETLGNHVVELAVPFLYFAPQPVASLAGLATIGFQGWLMLTGNFSWLNALTIVLAFSTFSDGVLAAVLPIAAPAPAPMPTYLVALSLALAVGILVLSVRPALNLLSPGQLMNTAFDPLHLVNTYGAFGRVTETRYELVLEGTRATVPTEDADWQAYEVPGKPTDPAKRPPQIAPYHHRLGWQLWFAAMSPSPRRHPWVYRLLEQLLAADPGTRSLLATDPFGDVGPTHVRVTRYRYRFTTPAERAETGDWWHRERVGTYVGPVSHDDLRGPGAPGRRER